MHGLILAGGDGSRLSASGIAAPKALVPIAGQPQLVRLVEACRRVGCETVTCAVRADLAAEATALLAGRGVRVVPVRTPTSLHTLHAGLQATADGDVLCSLVDTVMAAADWDAAHAAATAALREADAVVAVTPLVEDESPLWVEVRPDGRVVGFGRRADPPLVTGGLYWLSARARQAAADAVEGGVARLRGYLSRLIDAGHRVDAVEVARIIDVDTGADLAAALALVDAEENG